MLLKALIVEQLESDGSLRTLKMVPDMENPLVVAFCDEYDEPREGAFHFLNDSYAAAFASGFATAMCRKAGNRRFYKSDSGFHFETSWIGIPTEQHQLTYYALSLPEFAVPSRISVYDPHTQREYKKSVNRDEQRRRFNIYFECRSFLGSFDFILETEFVIGRRLFKKAEYTDGHTDEYGRQIDEYEWCLGPDQRDLVQQFFAENIVMRDNYSAGQAGAIGPNAKASQMTFQQIWNSSQGDINLCSLAQELPVLRSAMRKDAVEPAHDKSIVAISEAEEAAKDNDGRGVMEQLNKAGKWAWEIASKLGLIVATDALKKALGL